MAVSAGDRGSRSQNVRPGAGGGAAFVADGDGDEVTVPEIPDRGDARLQRLQGMLPRPVKQDVIRGSREGLRGTVRIPDQVSVRIHQARHEGDIPQVDARSARGWCGAGEVDVGDLAVVHQHEDRAIGGVVRRQRDGGVSELWICYPLTDAETSQAE